MLLEPRKELVREKLVKYIGQCLNFSINLMVSLNMMISKSLLLPIDRTFLILLFLDQVDLIVRLSYQHLMKRHASESWKSILARWMLTKTMSILRNLPEALKILMELKSKQSVLRLVWMLWDVVLLKYAMRTLLRESALYKQRRRPLSTTMHEKFSHSIFNFDTQLLVE